MCAGSDCKCVTFIFEFGHAWVQYNETADSLATKSTIEGGRLMNKAIIMNAIRRVFRLRVEFHVPGPISIGSDAVR